MNSDQITSSRPDQTLFPEVVQPGREELPGSEEGKYYQPMADSNKKKIMGQLPITSRPLSLFKPLSLCSK